MLHPHLGDLIPRIRSHGSIATLITNGYLLTPDRIQRLNRAGLDSLLDTADIVREAICWRCGSPESGRKCA